jgi:hypothetical protein
MFVVKDYYLDVFSSHVWDALLPRLSLLASSMWFDMARELDKILQVPQSDILDFEKNLETDF